MYSHNEIGPWPIVDLAHSKVTRTDTQAISLIGSPLNVLLDTVNLGGSSEAFINNYYDGASGTGVTIANTQQMAFGVLLKPMDFNEDRPVYVDVSIKAQYWEDEYEGKGSTACAFIGLIDSGLSPTDGFDATNNKVTDYMLIPALSGDNNIDLTDQICIKNIVSSGLINDQYLCVGFVIRNGTTAETIDYMISARYAYQPFNTFKRY